MSLKERVYSVLVVSASEKLNIALSDMLPESRYQPIKVVSGVSAGKRAWNERSYDFVIINSPLPDDAGIRFSIDTGSASDVVVLLMVRAEHYNDIHEKLQSMACLLSPNRFRARSCCSRLTGCLLHGNDYERLKGKRSQ